MTPDKEEARASSGETGDGASAGRSEGDGGRSGGPRSSASVRLLLAIAILYSAYVARDLLLPLALAAIVAIILWPIVRFGHERLRVPRSVGSALVLLGLVAVTLTSMALLSGPAVRWLDRVPQLLREVEFEVRRLDSPIEEVQEASERVEELATMDDGQADDVVTVRMQQTSLVSAAMTQARGAAVLFTLTLALLYFLLVSGEAFLQRLIEVSPAPRDERDKETLFRSIQREVSAYVLTIAAINSGLGAAIGVAMALMGLPNAALWGFMAATLNFIPYLGAIIGALVVTLVATASDADLGFALLTGGVYIGLSAIEGSFITPLILGRRMTLNPAVLFVGILFWGWVWGIPGVLLATPLLVAMKIIFDATRSLRPVGQLMGR